VPDLRWEFPRNKGGVTGKHRGHDVARRPGREQGGYLGRRRRELEVMETASVRK
jgi:hypothetical protein